MIHILASQSSWRSVQMLVKNLSKEGLDPDYQTYAGLLEVCGNIKDQRRTERILVEMDLKVGDQKFYFGFLFDDSWESREV